MPSGERAACPSSSIVGIAPERTAEPPQDKAGPQGPRWLMKVRKGFLEVDLPLHQPKKKKIADTTQLAQVCKPRTPRLYHF